MSARTVSLDPAPLSDMNITPLIDVLLVLLVMFIITIPIQTHAVKLDLPSGEPVPQPLPTANLLVIESDGALRWNSAPISRAVLRQELRITQQMIPVPELHLRPAADAPYGEVDETLALIKREHVAKFGFVGNEAYALR